MEELSNSERTRLEMDLAFLKKAIFKGEEVSYDEALVYFTHQKSILDTLPVDDIAFGNFFDQCRVLRKYLNVVNLLNSLNRTEHLVRLQVMVAGNQGSVAELEVAVLIPLTKAMFYEKAEIREAAQRQARKEKKFLDGEFITEIIYL